MRNFRGGGVLAGIKAVEQFTRCLKEAAPPAVVGAVHCTHFARGERIVRGSGE